MNRSRNILLTAWLVLGLVAVFQVTRPASPTESETETGPGADSSTGGLPYAQSSAESETVGENAAEHAGIERQGEGHRESDGRSGRSSGIVDPVAEIPGIVDDPSHWHRAGVVLAAEAVVATVIGPGVVSVAEPEPGPVQHWFPNPTQFGGDRTFLVVDQDSSTDYVKVSLPVMPNGQEGWILRSEVELTEIDHRALVDLSDATVTVWHGDEKIVDTRAVTGKRSTPTPVGVFYIRDIVPQTNPDGGFGPYVLALSGFSETLETFQGGLPALAIHGTNRPSQIGSERSNGCVRIPNELITLLADSVPLGTPVTVVA